MIRHNRPALKDTRPAARQPLLTAALLAGSLLLGSAAAQAERPKVGFLTSVEVPDGDDLHVWTRDGVLHRGCIRSSTEIFGSVTKFTLKTHDGQKVKLKAADVDEIIMPVNDLWRTVMLAESSDTLEEIWSTDYERIFEVDELVFHSVRHPKSERTSIRQLVNPGFDSRLRVYYLPMSTEGIFSSDDLPVFGDMPRAFLVIKDDGDVQRIKQSSYRDEAFLKLFGDCPELLERYQGKKRKFKFFAEHVFLYDQMCPGPGSPTYPPTGAPT